MNNLDKLDNNNLDDDLEIKKKEIKLEKTK